MMAEVSPCVTEDDESDGSPSYNDISADVDDWNLPVYFDEPWHNEPIVGAEREEPTWRLKEKYKTHCVALVLCLNVGVDPPDVVKTQPCAKLESWFDPTSLPPTKALEAIGHALQSQYERWQPRARYKQSLDPTCEDVKKLCCSLRRNAKDERVLFHYNGHGVPKPTSQGEIWVFNRSYTQYIPLSMYDLQSWMGAPSLYVYDCSNAGVILDNFVKFAEQHERDAATAGAGDALSFRNCVQLGACREGEALPMNPELPADLFTACLTTPVKMAVRWFVLRNRHRLPPHTPDLIDKIPGQVSDRRTMLGELNWILTAVTDTIAWSSVTGDTFQRLFRADLLTASLCRNFLVAQRVLRAYNCTPVAQPALPQLERHPLWAAWERALDQALKQLPLAPSAAYRPSPFFREQLCALRVWLQRPEPLLPPPALPVALQVLLSTALRARALALLRRLKPKDQLDVGVFPYMLKLLQAAAPDLRPHMLRIWASILAYDPSCQVDLVNAKGHKYFLAVLQDPNVDMENRTLAAFVLTQIVNNYPPGQEAALNGGLISICLELLCEERSSAELLSWLLLALGGVWKGSASARRAGARDLAHEKLCALLGHASGVVRAACALALGSWLGAGAFGCARTSHDHLAEQLVASQLSGRVTKEGCALARAELGVALQWTVVGAERLLVLAAARPSADQAVDALAPDVTPRPTKRSLPPLPLGSVYCQVWKAILALAEDPHPVVHGIGATLKDRVLDQMEIGEQEFEVVRMASPSMSDVRVRQTPRRHRLSSSAPEEQLVRSSISSTGSGVHSDTDNVRCVCGAASGPCADTSLQQKQLVSTHLLVWLSARYAKTLHLKEQSEHELTSSVDPLSRSYHETQWRFQRNEQMRIQGQNLRAMKVRGVESQAFQSRVSLPPKAVLFHPYDQQLVLANRDHIGTWDWGTGARLSLSQWRLSLGRPSSLCLINSESRPLVGVLSVSGRVGILRLGGNNSLSAVAWWVGGRGGAMAYRGGHMWVGGHSVVNQWDVRKEMLCRELTAPDDNILTLQEPMTHTQQLVGGSASGSVLVWDLRSGDRLQRYPGEGAPLLLAAHRPDQYCMLSVSTDGEVVAWDTRQSRPLHKSNTSTPLTAAAIHPNANLLACGSMSSGVQVTDVRGVMLHNIKFHEGFMGARIGPVQCLNFHPHRLALAVGCKDASVSVYVSDTRR